VRGVGLELLLDHRRARLRQAVVGLLAAGAAGVADHAVHHVERIDARLQQRIPRQVDDAEAILTDDAAHLELRQLRAAVMSAAR